jgi:SAM-dependent methyltransferase
MSENASPSTDRIQDPVYRTKLVDLPNIISDWVSQYRTLDSCEILDFGCGEATSALGFALHPEIKRVVGIDIMPDPDLCAPLARQHLGLTNLPAKLALHRVRPGALHNPVDKFDLIYSWSVFEHIRQDLLSATVQMLRMALRPGGFLFVQIAPLFYSSEGSHYFPQVPERWGHLINQTDLYREKLAAAVGSEEHLRAALSTYETLNRITASELVRVIEGGGFEILRDYRTREDYEIPPGLLTTYNEEVLRTNQIVLLARPLN